MNRYKIVNASDPNLTLMMSYCVGRLENQRYSLDLTQIVLKLPVGTTENYPVFDSYPDITDILTVLSSAEWALPKGTLPNIL